MESRLSLDQNSQALVSATIARVRIHERQLVHVAKHMRSIEPNVQQSPPQRELGEFQTRDLSLQYHLLESRFPLDRNPQALVFATIARVRIHERRLVHVVKHTGIIEPNVQHLPSISSLEDKGDRVDFFYGKFLLCGKNSSIDNAKVIGIREGRVYKLMSPLAQALVDQIGRAHV